MTNRNNENTVDKGERIYEPLIPFYAAFTGITSVALLISSFLSLDAHVEANDRRKLNLSKIGNSNKIDKFTMAIAALFGAELLGGLLWQKSAEKKADSFAARIEQGKAAPAASPSAPSR